MANKIFVKVSADGGSTWTILPAPSDYQMTTEDLVDSARNTKGVMIGSVIRQGVRRIDLTWNILSQTDFTTIMTFFDSNFTFLCYYYDTHLGSYQQREMYVGNRKSQIAKMKMLFNSSDEIDPTSVHYEGFSLALIEV